MNDKAKDINSALIFFSRAAVLARMAIKNDRTVLYGSKVTAQVKRASMDLARALAEMRKP